MIDSEFITDLKKFFKESDLYKIYNLDPKCSSLQIKKAYKTLSLLYHPDRNATSLKDESTKKFQLISKIHYILSNDDRRSAYDNDGSVEDDTMDWNDDLDQWEAYWRALYPKITLGSIEKFEESYKNSADERKDLKRLYLEHEGDMDKIMESHILSCVSEEARYRAMIDDMISGDEVPAYKLYIHETAKKTVKRRKAEEKENKEFESHGTNMKDLITAIQTNKNKNKSSMDVLMADLEARYAPGSKGKKRKKT